MNRVQHLGVTLATLILLVLVCSQTAHAAVDIGSCHETARTYYIDPGTGSIVIQVLIGAFVAGVAMIGVYRMRVKIFVRTLFRRRRPGSESDDSEDIE